MRFPNFRDIYASFRSREEEDRYIAKAMIRFSTFVSICFTLKFIKTLLHSSP
ncbi:hypothetical protein HMI56_007257 [Coelomomyces lativittatus]|nr:hypothetical protein HMI56_007257 [Coelomomyces lativittatus]